MNLSTNKLLDAAQQNNNFARCLIDMAVRELNKKLEDPNEKQKFIKQHGTFVMNIALPFIEEEK